MNKDFEKTLRNWECIIDFRVLKAKITEFIESSSPEEVVTNLNSLYYSDVKGRWFHGYFGIINCIFDEGCVGYELKRALYEEAAEKEFKEVKYMLFTPYSPFSEDKSLQHYDKIFDELTVGERKWKARLGIFLERLIHDPEPQVIEVLLKNPKLKEEHVLKIVTKRPVSSNIIGEVLKFPNWILRYKIQKGLIFNPFVASSVKVAILPLMKKQDLKEAKHSFNEDIKDIIKKLLEKYETEQAEE